MGDIMRCAGAVKLPLLWRAVGILRLTFLLLCFGICGELAKAQSGAVVLGRVVDDVRNEGIGHVHIALTGNALGNVPVTIDSDASGAFSFSKLKAGTYRLDIDRTGFFPQRVSELTVEENGLKDLGRITVVTSRTLSGQVRWQDNEPAEGVTVQLQVLSGDRFQRRTPRAVPAPPQLTDENGKFKILNVPPGKYNLIAYASPRTTPDNFNPRIGRPSYFPGQGPGQYIDLWSLDEFNGISITLFEVKGTTVSGKVIASESVKSGTQVTVGLVVANSLARPIMNVSVRVDDSFRFSGVPPGGYYVVVQAGPASPLGSVQRIQVEETPISDLILKMPESARVMSGTAEFEDQQQEGITTASLAPRLYMQGGAEELGMIGQAAATVDQRGGGVIAGQVSPKGSFVFQGAYDGVAYDMHFYNLDVDSYISKVIQADEVQTSGPYWFRVGAPIKIFLRRDGGKVSGMVLSSDKPAASAFVVLVPKNRIVERYLDSTRFFDTMTDQQGAYAFSGIPPGQYDIIALDRNEDDGYLTPNYIAKFGPRTTAITVSPRGVLSQRLELIHVSK